MKFWLIWCEFSIILPDYFYLDPNPGVRNETDPDICNTAKFESTNGTISETEPKKIYCSRGPISIGLLSLNLFLLKAMNFCHLHHWKNSCFCVLVGKRVGPGKTPLLIAYWNIYHFFLSSFSSTLLISSRSRSRSRSISISRSRSK